MSSRVGRAGHWIAVNRVALVRSKTRGGWHAWRSLVSAGRVAQSVRTGAVKELTIDRRSWSAVFVVVGKGHYDTGWRSKHMTVYLPSFIVSHLVPFFDIINFHLYSTLERVLCKPGTKGLVPYTLIERWRQHNAEHANSRQNIRKIQQVTNILLVSKAVLNAECLRNIFQYVIW